MKCENIDFGWRPLKNGRNAQQPNFFLGNIYNINDGYSLNKIIPLLEVLGYLWGAWWALLTTILKIEMAACII